MLRQLIKVLTYATILKITRSRMINMTIGSQKMQVIITTENTP